MRAQIKNLVSYLIIGIGLIAYFVESKSEIFNIPLLVFCLLILFVWGLFDFILTEYKISSKIWLRFGKKKINFRMIFLSVILGGSLIYIVSLNERIQDVNLFGLNFEILLGIYFVVFALINLHDYQIIIAKNFVRVNIDKAIKDVSLSKINQINDSGSLITIQTPKKKFNFKISDFDKKEFGILRKHINDLKKSMFNNHVR